MNFGLPQHPVVDHGLIVSGYDLHAEDRRIVVCTEGGQCNYRSILSGETEITQAARPPFEVASRPDNFDTSEKKLDERRITRLFSKPTQYTTASLAVTLSSRQRIRADLGFVHLHWVDLGQTIPQVGFFGIGEGVELS